MDKVTIPPEVVEAMARAWLKTLCGIETDADWRHWIPEVTAAARAMLAAWPGVYDVYDNAWIGPVIILPLLQETKP